ncbi:MAG: hypothetical protein Q6J68_07490 [Thermostichales cyanobacterium SZTDM-1c_bins_54]
MLPLPPHWDPERVGQVWRVPYQERSVEARAWAQSLGIPPASADRQRIALLLIDVQNTFCLPDFELFVQGAVADNQRLGAFIYRHLDAITQIVATLDTHTATQIFHPCFWVNSRGEHPTPAATQISYAEVEAGEWQVNPEIAATLGMDLASLQAYARHYTATLTQAGKYPLTIWPYHSMLGGIGHALVPAIEEAIFFHSIARYSQARYELKGNHPLTENYSVLSPEVLTNPQGDPIAHKNQALIEDLLGYDAILIAGQAKSHCVAWTVADLLREIQARDPQLAQKVYLLEDCTSPVVVPGVVDFSEAAASAFADFAAAGMHRVQSTVPMTDWLLPSGQSG